MICDLHMHSVHSDGSLDVPALVAALHRAGVAAFSLTDHDTLDGWPAAQAEAARHGLQTLSGTELSTRIDGHELHILGYGVDPADSTLRSLLDHQKAARRERIPRIVERLNALGVPLTLGQVRAAAGDSNPGRPHVALALRTAGHVSSMEEAFARYLADGGPACVPKQVPSPVQAVRAVVDAGGVAVWAHPLARPLQRPGGVDLMAQELRAAGLGGLEVVHPAHSRLQRRRLRRLAQRLGLLETGGSDFHGAATPHVRLGVGRGEDRVPIGVFEQLREACGRP